MAFWLLCMVIISPGKKKVFYVENIFSRFVRVVKITAVGLLSDSLVPHPPPPTPHWLSLCFSLLLVFFICSVGVHACMHAYVCIRLCAVHTCMGIWYHCSLYMDLNCARIKTFHCRKVYSKG